MRSACTVHMHIWSLVLISYINFDGGCWMVNCVVLLLSLFLSMFNVRVVLFEFIWDTVLAVQKYSSFTINRFFEFARFWWAERTTIFRFLFPVHMQLHIFVDNIQIEMELREEKMKSKPKIWVLRMANWKKIMKIIPSESFCWLIDQILCVIFLFSSKS